LELRVETRAEPCSPFGVKYHPKPTTVTINQRVWITKR